MDRRNFLQLGASTAAITATATQLTAAAAPAKRRVGLIGSGWYGKCDLLRLIQVEPENIEVVSLCDVDSNMLDQAAEIVASRQVSGRRPRTSPGSASRG